VDVFIICITNTIYDLEKIVKLKKINLM